MKTAILVSISLVMAALGAGDQPLKVGVGRIDITPDYPVRMTGYAVRKTEATNAAQRIWAKALAIGEKEPALFLTVDNCGIQGTMVDDLARRLQRDGVKAERIALCSSHTHSAPTVAGFAPNLFVQDLPPEEQGRIERYTRDLADKLEQVARVALRDRRPAHLTWSQGEARFAKNRRTQGGPVDHSLPVLRVTDADGKLRALVANYACHCTTLGGDFNQFHGDWSGYAQEFLERDHPGAVALISIGCGADANPSPRGTLDHARQHGEELAREVKHLLARTFVPLKGSPECRSKQIQLPFQKHFTRAEWEERAKRSGIVGYHARKNLARLDRGEALPTNLAYRVHTWTFGDDLAMVFMAGEVVVDYSLRLKKELDSSRLWVTAYANDVPCYIPSSRILQEGGYEAEDSLWYYDRPARLAPESEELIIKTVHELLPKNFVDDPKKAEFPPPKPPDEALGAFRARANLEVELVAAEPLIVDPVAIDWGADGRLWVVEMHDYPSGMDGDFKPGGRVKVLSDHDADGKYDRASLFLDGLPFPTGIMAWNKGALICAAPDILYAEDSDGDGRADSVRTNFTGFATHNYQARVNGLTWGLDGWVYGASGLFGGKIKSVMTGKEADLGGRDFRMNPGAGEIEPVAGLSQQGRVRDDWDNWFGCDNSTLIWHFPLPDHYVRRNPYVPAPDPRVYPVKDPEPNRLYPASRTLERFNDPSHANHTTSACGLEIYRDTILGTNYYGNAFVCEPVHNLVHRLVLEPGGATFSARRASGEQRTEFLASTDNWFRPVQARTGPDGALWVVDMYRFVIEHPRWISSNRLATLDVRAGDDKGRIYRVYPRGTKPRSIENIARMNASELVAKLDGPNGPKRDLIHRELLSRTGVPLDELLVIATNGLHAAARVQALWLLKHFGRSEVASRRDKDPNVRCQAVRLVTPGIRSGLTFLHSVDPREHTEPMAQRTAFEIALAMGNYADPAAASTLADLASQAKDDRWLKAAIVSSAVPHLAPLLEKLLAQEGIAPDLLEKLITTAVRASDEAAVAHVFQAAIPKADEKPTDRQFQLLAAILNAQSPPTVSQSAKIATVLDDARKAARTGSTAAIALLAHQPEQLQSDVRLLTEIASHHPAAFERLRQVRHVIVAESVLSAWPQLPPATRSKFIDLLVTREDWSKQLRTAVDRGGVSIAEIPLAARQKLRIAPPPDASRAEVLAKYHSVKDLEAHPENGAALFEKNCASCHAFRGAGHAVGPNLAEFAGKSVTDFVLAILDPNAVVEPRFAGYSIETRDGRSLSGVVRGETATSLTLVQGGGFEEKLLRSDIAEIRASAISVMPEGLEQSITPQDMADLVAWLKQGAPAPFGGATAEQVRRSRDMFARDRTPFRIVTASEQLDYSSWLGRLPLAHCRQSDGKGRVVWEAAAIGRRFRFPAALGYISQPAGHFELLVNGKPALQFDVTLHDEAWRSDDGKVRMAYAVRENNSEDSNGILTIEIEAVDAGGPVRLEVRGSSANSQRWFGLYLVGPETSMAGGR
ncbi:MAG: neutral/alkaline non-lysosomal ceramidase N-terminal domain-containing protein [Verrucomicrobia subdivision 3 bacterium]|nr:neutral/alkaline non-lysosomal ceramidase N-terminal domain-containing protein [Limisphaerales bacterium]